MPARRVCCCRRTTCGLLLTGDAVTDCSDASGTLWLDVAARRWSAELLAACGLDERAHAARRRRQRRPPARCGPSSRRASACAAMCASPAAAATTPRARSASARCRRGRASSRSARRAWSSCDRPLPAQSAAGDARVLPRAAGALAPDVGDAVGRRCGAVGRVGARLARRGGAAARRRKLGGRGARRCAAVPAVPVRRTHAAQRRACAGRGSASRKRTMRPRSPMRWSKASASGCSTAIARCRRNPVTTRRCRWSAAVRAARSGSGCWRRRWGGRCELHQGSDAGAALGAARLAWLADGGSEVEVCRSPALQRLLEPVLDERALLLERHGRFRRCSMRRCRPRCDGAEMDALPFRRRSAHRGRCPMRCLPAHAKPWAGARRRLAAAVAPCRADCAAVLALGSRRRTRFVRCAHCAQTSCDESVSRSALRAPTQALGRARLLAAADARRHAPAHGFAGNAGSLGRGTTRCGPRARSTPRRARSGARGESQARCLRLAFSSPRTCGVCKDALGRRAQRLCGDEQRRGSGPRAQRAS